MGTKLDAGETLPSLDLKLVGGGSIRLPDLVGLLETRKKAKQS